MLKTNKVHVRKENENNLQVIMFYKIHNSCKPVCHFRKQITLPPPFFIRSPELNFRSLVVRRLSSRQCVCKLAQNILR